MLSHFIFKTIFIYMLFFPVFCSSVQQKHLKSKYENSLSFGHDVDVQINGLGILYWCVLVLLHMKVCWTLACLCVSFAVLLMMNLKDKMLYFLLTVKIINCNPQMRWCLIFYQLIGNVNNFRVCSLPILTPLELFDISPL